MTEMFFFDIIYLALNGVINVKKIDLKDFTLESFDYDNKEHVSMINKFDWDKEIDKYIIKYDDSFSDQIAKYEEKRSNDIYNTLYMVRLLLTDEIIGALGLDGSKEDLYLEYAILKKYRSKGYCLSLIKELLERIKEDTTQISLLIDRDNEPSKCLALRAGFEKVCEDEYNYDKYQIKS